MVFFSALQISLGNFISHPLIFSVTFKLDTALTLYFHAFPSLPPSLQWEELLSHDPLQKSLISVYKEILSFDCSPVTKVKAVWEQELGLHLGDDWWDTAPKKMYTSSACARLTLIQFKVLFRVHYSKTCHKSIPLSLTIATNAMLHLVI